MHQAVDILESAAGRDATGAFAVTQRAIASATKVIMRTDDSSGIIGDACRRLLDLHARLAPLAEPPAAKLLDWMIAFQFPNECDYSGIDPVAYASALGDTGVAAYRARLDEIAARLDPKPASDQRWSSPHSHQWFVIELLQRRPPGRRRVEVPGVQVLVVVETAVGDGGVPT